MARLSLDAPLLDRDNDAERDGEVERATKSAPVGRKTQLRRGVSVKILDTPTQFDLLDSSSEEEEDDEEVNHGRRGWGRYASLVSRTSRRCGSIAASRASRSSRTSRVSFAAHAQARRSTRCPREHVEIYAKTREWDGVGSSSSDDDMPGAQDRHARYARFAEEIEAEKSEKAEGAKESTALRDHSNIVLGLACCVFCFLQNGINASLVVLFVRLENLPLACCLAPSGLFLAFLEVCLASTDRSLMHARYRLQRRASAVRRWALEVFVFLVLGCLHAYKLLEASRYWKRQDPQGSFLTELENLDPSGRMWVGRRWNSHYLLWSVPTVVCLTCSMALGSVALPGQAFWGLVLVVALLSAAASVESFDYATSYEVRKWHGMVYDGFRWMESTSVDCSRQRLHRTIRCCDVLRRVLVLATLSLVIIALPACGIALLLADYLICFGVLWANSGFTLEVPVVSVVLFLANIARHVDEPGFALPALRVSRVLDVMRDVEAAFALLVAAAVAAGSFCPEARIFGAVLLPLLVVVQAAFLLSCRRLSSKGRRGDLFTAVMEADPSDLSPIEDSLSFEGGCTVDMVICDGTQQTALHLAAERGRLDIVQLLLKLGAKRNSSDSKMQTPLHLAVRGLHEDVARALLDEDRSEMEEDGAGSPKQIFLMVRQMNIDGEKPRDLIQTGSAPALAKMLDETESQGYQAELSNRTRATSSQSSRGRSETVSSSLMHNLFGSIVGGEHFSVNVGPKEKVQRAELAAFMFFRGMGEQLQRLHLYFRHFKSKKSRGSQRVHISNLLTVTTLGAGGFGKVLKVEDVRSGEFYALKLQCRNKTTKQAVREAQALSAGGEHPYIVELVQIFRTSAFYGILMEFCDKDLNRRILDEESQFGRIEGLSREVAARYTACVMFALEYLHDQSIVFRDLKPENVLIRSKEDLAKLTDFGLARRVDQETNEEGVLTEPTMSVSAGTLGFMSSEAFRGSMSEEQHSPRWYAARDWYSLGCCLLLMLLGEGGGRKVYAAKRHVLLPPQQDDIQGVLSKAAEADLISQDAAALVSSLTAEVEVRGDAKFCRRSPFLQEAILDLEPPALQPVYEDEE